VLACKTCLCVYVCTYVRTYECFARHAFYVCRAILCDKSSLACNMYVHDHSCLYFTHQFNRMSHSMHACMCVYIYVCMRKHANMHKISSISVTVRERERHTYAHESTLHITYTAT
jgi:hypothetical protein